MTRTPVYDDLREAKHWSDSQTSAVEDEWEAVNLSPVGDVKPFPVPAPPADAIWHDEDDEPRWVSAEVVSRLAEIARPADGPGVGKPLREPDPDCNHERFDPETGEILGGAWYFAGSAENRVTRKDCDRPNLLRCRHCNGERSIVCGRRRESRCAPCSTRYKGRVRSIARMPLQVLSGTNQHGTKVRRASGALLTLTAPGVRPHCLTHTYEDFDARTGRTVDRPSVYCYITDDADGYLTGTTCVMCPCTTSATALGHVFDGDSADGSRPVNLAVTRGERLAAFNGSMTDRFNDFVTDLRRVDLLGSEYRALAGFTGFEYFRAVEPQSRGALHLHVLVKFDRVSFFKPRDVLAALRRLAIAHGFGHEVDLAVLATDDDLAKAARYVAKYVTKTLDGSYRTKDGKTARRAVPMPYRSEDCDSCALPDAPKATRLVKRGTTAKGTWFRISPHVDARTHDHPRKRIRAWTCSRGWGLSMRSLLDSQRLYARGQVELSRQLLADALGVDLAVVERMASDGAAFRAANPPPTP